MNQIHYPFEDNMPLPGQLMPVTEGIYWLRMKLPFALNHINLWLLRDCLNGVEGWTAVDCGITSQDTKESWEQIFANHLQGLPIVRVLVTHMHPDHVGLAHWLCERFNAPLWMSMTDFLMARWLSSKEGGMAIGSVSGGGGSADHFARHGLTSEEDLEKVRARSDYYSNLVPAVPQRFHRIQDHDIIEIGGRQWRAISGFGHAPEHMSLVSEDSKIMITGDMLLPRISTNVSVYDGEPDADPLGLFLDSLKKYLPLDPQTLLLPSHGKPFQGMHFRIDELVKHHDDRLAETFEACKEPTTAREIVPVLFKRELDIHQLTFAMGETIAHLNYLMKRGKLNRISDSEGIWRFSQKV